MLGKWNELSSYWFFDVNDLPVFPLQPPLQNGYSDREKSENQKRSKKGVLHCRSPFSPHSPTRSLKQDSDVYWGGYVHTIS